MASTAVTESNPFETKCRSLRKEGLQAIRSGKIAPFAGFQSVHEDMHIVAATFKNTDVLNECILKPITAFQQESGMGLLIAGRDFPIHATIIQARGTGKQFMISRHRHAFTRASLDMLGTHVRFPQLIPAKESLLLNATDVPENILAARKSMRDAFSLAEMDVKEVPDMFHMSVARITSIGEPSNLKRYLEFFEGLSRLFANEPFELVINELFEGKTRALLIDPNAHSAV